MKLWEMKEEALESWKQFQMGNKKKAAKTAAVCVRVPRHMSWHACQWHGHQRGARRRPRAGAAAARRRLPRRRRAADDGRDRGARALLPSLPRRPAAGPNGAEPPWQGLGRTELGPQHVQRGAEQGLGGGRCRGTVERQDQGGWKGEGQNGQQLHLQSQKKTRLLE